MSFDGWASDYHDVSSLRLDPRNPRFGDDETVEVATQESIAHALYVNARLEDLILGIARDGYSPAEVLVAVEEHGDLVVVEGNRRLAAVKFLLGEVNIAGAGKPAVMTALASQLFVAVAPSRDSATPYILKRHTESAVVKWSRLSQARFIWRHRSDFTVDELASETGLGAATLRKNRRLGQIDAAVEGIIEDVTSAGRLPALERIMNNSRARERLGLVDDDPLSSEAVDAITRLASFLGSDSAANTRTLNTGDQIEHYLDRVFEVVHDSGPLPKQEGAPAVSSDIGASKPETPGQRPDEDTGAPPEESPSFQLAPTGQRFVFLDSHLASTTQATHLSRFAAIAEEMRKLNTNQFPNATMVLLRTLIEVGAREEHATDGKSIKSSISGTVSATVERLRSQIGKEGADTLQNEIKGAEKWFSALHNAAHSSQVSVTPDTARGTTATWLPFLEAVWKRISKGLHQ